MSTEVTLLPKLYNVSCAGEVLGGQSVGCGVSFIAEVVAPEGGFLINLSTPAGPVFGVPASATIPAGARSAPFTVTTQSVAEMNYFYVNA